MHRAPLPRLTGLLAFALLFSVALVSGTSLADDKDARTSVGPAEPHIYVTMEGPPRYVFDYAHLDTPPAVPEYYVSGVRLDLRDDGRGGDAVAGDKLFTAHVPRSVVGVMEAGSLREAQALEKASAAERVWMSRSLPSETVQAQEGLVPLANLRAISRTATKIVPEKSLVITDLSVVEDARASGMGPWSFGTLMKSLADAGGVDPRGFVRRWIGRWERDLVVNDFTVPKRTATAKAVLDAWPVDKDGLLDLGQAPFRLLAIVNRVDLRGPAFDPKSRPTELQDAGEARFVYCATDKDGNALQFLIIFEYGIKTGSPSATQAWGKRWVDLSAVPFGVAYNNALQSITDTFTTGNHLNQLRTNEFIQSPWELREFVIAASGSHKGHLRAEPVKQSPNLATFNRKAELKAWIEGNALDVVAERHSVPLVHDPVTGSPFLSGSSIAAATWAGPNPKADPILPREARHKFSLNTCNGCHSGETGTGFKHIDVRAAGAASSLSKFMTGIAFADPVHGSPTRFFDEFSRRTSDLDVLVNAPWVPTRARPLGTFVH